MLYINEWLPDPIGKDDGEFIELYESGGTTGGRAISLDGYFLSTGGKKKFSLSGRTISPGGYLLLPRSATKLSLKNTDGGLWLYGPDGSLVDNSSFLGAAQPGRSWSREDYNKGSGVQAFAWEAPTPGGKNRAITTAVTDRSYPTGVTLSRQPSPLEISELIAGTSIVLVIIFLYVIKKNTILQKFFFQGNIRTREGARPRDP